ncbi:uncharacterized, partial [Tachysurus ichikawai]
MGSAVMEDAAGSGGQKGGGMYHFSFKRGVESCAFG